VLAFRLSERLGHSPPEDTARLIDHLSAVGLPTTIGNFSSARPAPERLLGYMQRDKKVAGGKLKFVLVRGIGRAFLSSDVPPGAVTAVLAE
jgi:3-dehydroquinate synthase